MRTHLLIAVVLWNAGAAELAVMPLPAKWEAGSGELVIDRTFRAEMNGSCGAAGDAALRRMSGRLAMRTGIPVPVVQPTTRMTVICDASGEPLPALGEDESYRLSVTAEGARLKAPRTVGAMRGMETFLQLVRNGPRGFSVASIVIDDRPRFGWRGLSLDTSRHFLPVDSLKRTLDGMAAVKLNVFHWHLVDDQGFRIESKRYPALHGKGSDGQFYTQDQAKEIIAYAAARGIRVVPEFDIPGHTTSWFVGMPELASGKGPYEIERRIGIFGAAMDPSNEQVYTVLDGFLAEMAALFPDPYLHIGGDEINGKEWNANASIQQFIQAKGLKNNDGLHAYFNQRLLAIVKKHGKMMVGWDEVLHPGVPKDVVIQSWRGQKSLAEAVRGGYRALLSNGYYLDLNHPAAQHYRMDPLGGAADGLTAEQKARVLGGEACLWAEWVSPENLDIKLWPRLAAVAERLWSAAGTTDVDAMYRRLTAVKYYLDLMGMKHKSNQVLMLKRLTGEEDIAALQTLAAVVEPVKDYVRSSIREYQVTYPLNRLVDAVAPESDEAREPVTKEKLLKWRDNHARLLPVLLRSAALTEVIALSQGLSEVASLGLEALDQPAQKRTPAWKKEKLAELQRIGTVNPKPEETKFCKELLAEYDSSPAMIQRRCLEPRPAADLLLVVKPQVAKLVTAASQPE
jgi:hexosaminidase